MICVVELLGISACSLLCLLCRDLPMCGELIDDHETIKLVNMVGLTPIGFDVSCSNRIDGIDGKLFV